MMKWLLFKLSVESVKKGGDLASILSKASQNGEVFLYEIHARDIAEILYSAMEDIDLNIIVSDNKPPVRLSMAPFTLVGATIDFGLLPEPMRAHFGQGVFLQPYTLEECWQTIPSTVQPTVTIVPMGSTTYSYMIRSIPPTN